jgi:hypothetical protein
MLRWRCAHVKTWCTVAMGDLASRTYKKAAQHLCSA